MNYSITVKVQDYENRRQSIHFINNLNTNKLIKMFKNKNINQFPL